MDGKIYYNVCMNSGMLNHLVYQGEYGTKLGEALSKIPEEARDDYRDAVGKLACDILHDNLHTMFAENGYSENFEVKYIATHNPSNYNGRTDLIEFWFSCDEELKSQLEDFAKKYEHDMMRYAVDHGMSYIGVNNIPLGAWLAFNVDDWYGVYDRQEMNGKFEQEAVKLIDEMMQEDTRCNSLTH